MFRRLPILPLLSVLSGLLVAGCGGILDGGSKAESNALMADPMAGYQPSGTKLISKDVTLRRSSSATHKSRPAEVVLAYSCEGVKETEETGGTKVLEETAVKARQVGWSVSAGPQQTYVGERQMMVKETEETASIQMYLTNVTSQPTRRLVVVMTLAG